MRLWNLSLLLLHLYVLEGFRWNNCLIRPSIRLAVRPRSSELSMSNKALKLAQEKYSWRGELPIMVDEENDLHAEEVMERLVQEMEEPPRVGEQITGHVINVDDSGALLSIRGKMPGYIPIAEASLIPVRRMPESLAVGDTITAEMIGTLRGMPVLSLRNAQLIDAWGRVAAARNNDELFTVQVLEVNRGGAVCSAFGGLKAFLPGSHFLGSADSSAIGRNVTVKLLEALEDDGKLVVSQRLAAAASAPTLQRGTLVSATVTGLRPYGVFLEVEGGHSGLLHISQISSDRVEDVAAHFSLGEALKVMILSHDKAAGRVALSTRVLETNAGDMLRDKAAVFSNAEETLARFLKKEETERREREESARELAAGLMLDSEGRLHSTEGTAPAAAAVTGATENTPTRIKSVPPAPSPLQEGVAKNKSGGGAVDQPEKKVDSQGAAAVKGRGRGRPRSVPAATRVALAANQKLPAAANVGSASLDAVEAATSTLTEAAGSDDATANAAPKKPRASRPRASKGASSAAPVTADIASASVVEGDVTAGTGKPLKQTKSSAAKRTKKAIDTATAASTEKKSTTSSSNSSSSGSLSDSIDSILASIRADADIPR